MTEQQSIFQSLKTNTEYNIHSPNHREKPNNLNGEGLIERTINYNRVLE